MQIKSSLLFFFFCFSCTMSSTLFGQLALDLTDAPIKTTVPALPKLDKSIVYPNLQSLILSDQAPAFRNAFSIQNNHVYNQYGFFCKQEANRDRKSVIPVRVRLGSLDEVNSKEYGSGLCQ